MGRAGRLNAFPEKVGLTACRTHRLFPMRTKSTVNSAGVYTKPTMRKRIFERIKAGAKGGRAGQWSARKAQLLAVAYKKAGGGYKT